MVASAKIPFFPMNRFTYNFTFKTPGHPDEVIIMHLSRSDERDECCIQTPQIVLRIM